MYCKAFKKGILISSGFSEYRQLTARAGPFKRIKSFALEDIGVFGVFFGSGLVFARRWRKEAVKSFGWVRRKFPQQVRGDAGR